MKLFYKLPLLAVELAGICSFILVALFLIFVCTAPILPASVLHWITAVLMYVSDLLS